MGCCKVFYCLFECKTVVKNIQINNHKKQNFKP